VLITRLDIFLEFSPSVVFHPGKKKSVLPLLQIIWQVFAKFGMTPQVKTVIHPKVTKGILRMSSNS
jgi:hypothetical protein